MNAHVESRIFFDSLGLSTVNVFKVLKKNSFLRNAGSFTSLLNSHYVILLHNLSFFCFPNKDDINLKMQII